ncbi:MAG: ATP-dependent Clp protease proteolytic subunit [Motiliproteus sp.]
MLQIKDMGLWLLSLTLLGCGANQNSNYNTQFNSQINAGIIRWDFENTDLLLDQRRILITSRINELTSKEVISKLIFLNQKDPLAPIELYIRTTGGWLNDAFSIIDIMHSITAPVNVHALGICQSAGTVILIGATGRRIAYPNSNIVPHFNRDEEVEPYSQEKLNRERFERLWRERTTIPEEWYPLIGDRLYNLTANEALEFGIVDDISTTPR